MHHPRTAHAYAGGWFNQLSTHSHTLRVIGARLIQTRSLTRVTLTPPHPFAPTQALVDHTGAELKLLRTTPESTTVLDLGKMKKKKDTFNGFACERQQGITVAVKDLDAASKHMVDDAGKAAKYPASATRKKTKEAGTNNDLQGTNNAPKTSTPPRLRFKAKLWTGQGLHLGDPPATFDWRNGGGIGTKCRDQINQVYSQGHCGSCYAFAVAGSLADRVCIAAARKGGAVPPPSKFSPQDMLACKVTAHPPNPSRGAPITLYTPRIHTALSHTLRVSAWLIQTRSLTRFAPLAHLNRRVCEAR